MVRYEKSTKYLKHFIVERKNNNLCRKRPQHAVMPSVIRSKFFRQIANKGGCKTYRLCSIHHRWPLIPRCGIWTISFVKSHFLRSSKLDAWRCIKSFTPEDKHRHLFCCVLLVPEYLVWFLSSCTAQADTAASQHHSCFPIHSTGLDWRTFRPIHKLDLSS